MLRLIYPKEFQQCVLLALDAIAADPDIKESASIEVSPDKNSDTTAHIYMYSEPGLQGTQVSDNNACQFKLLNSLNTLCPEGDFKILPTESPVNH